MVNQAMQLVVFYFGMVLVGLTLTVALIDFLYGLYLKRKYRKK